MTSIELGIAVHTRPFGAAFRESCTKIAQKIYIADLEVLAARRASVCGSMTCAFGVPESIIQGDPCPGSVGSPRDSAFAFGRWMTHVTLEFWRVPLI